MLRLTWLAPVVMAEDGTISTLAHKSGELSHCGEVNFALGLDGSRVTRNLNPNEIAPPL
jgi:hypothetical protein